jgi:dTMP kinase
MSAFITFEGPEGSGKTSQVASLAEFLKDQGLPVLVTREPGGTEIGDQIRAVLSNLDNVAMNPRAETLLFLAARAQLVEEVIRTHLKKGWVVLCDRYADSTLAYQGYGHGNDIAQLRAMIEFATGGLTPDITLLLDIDVEEGLRRRAQGGEWNRLDAYDLAFHQRVRAGYLKLAAEDPGRWVRIDAGKPAEEVQAAIRRATAERLAIEMGS